MAKRSGYQTSLPGLIGALVLCLLLIGGLVAAQRLLSLDTTARPDAVDYLDAVSQYQGEGTEVLYPESVPAGWEATSIDRVQGQRPGFGLGFLTSVDADTDFVGYKWMDASPAAVAERAMGEDVVEREPVTLETPGFGTEWTEWAHEGDTGWTTTYPAGSTRTLLVWGSAEKKVMVDFINTLTTDELATKRATPSPSPSAN